MIDRKIKKINILYEKIFSKKHVQIPSEYKQYFKILNDYITFIENKDKKLYSAYFNQIIDSLILELFFYDEIKLAGKEILKNLDQLDLLTNNMTDDTKMNIIKNQFDKLYDVYHPLRNNIETLDSIEKIRLLISKQ